MAKTTARKAMRDTLLSGYRHHSHERAMECFDRYLENGGEIPDIGLTLSTYADILAPEPFRAMQNSLICFITVICRLVISRGVEAEHSFSLSDYYVYEVERQATQEQLENLMKEILEQYADLVRQEKYREYSLPITRAIRYIRQHIYESCTVAQVSAQVRLNQQYFAVLFKKEVGCTPSEYIRRCKMEAAYDLLSQQNYTVSQSAEAVGYTSVSHFIRQFKTVYGATPKQLMRLSVNST